MRRGREIEKSKSSGESQQPLPCLPAAHRRQWRNTHGRTAALGSEVTGHGSLQASGTYGGRLPELGRSNDRSPLNSDAIMCAALGIPMRAAPLSLIHI